MLAACLGCAYVIWKFQARSLFDQENHLASTRLQIGNTTNIQLVSTNPITTKTNSTVNHVDGFFKIVIDQQSGKYVIVDSSKSMVALKDKDGNMIWSVDVVKFIGASPISSMRIVGDNLVVKVLMDYVVINKQTGKIENFVRSGPDKM